MFHFGPGPKQKDYNTDTDLIRSEIGIIVDGNKSALGASTGQYVILKNSTISGKTDGLYKAAQAIPANTAIDGSYLTAVSGGLGAEVASANSSISTINSKTFAQIYNDEITAGTSKTYTLTASTQVAMVFINNGNGAVAVWAISFRSPGEIGKERLSTAEASSTITTSGMTFTVACTYTAKVKVVVF